MKNVHLIEANKPSRLKKDNSGKLILLDNGLDSPSYTPMNIYITSDAEIKEGVNQWYLDKFLNKPKNSSGSQYGEKQDVIILTNDRDLIRDNIEPIDDTFLQWFVKNPSCEEVEVEQEILKLVHNPNYVNHTPNGDGIYLTPKSEDLQYGETLIEDNVIDYKIIIPKEEPIHLLSCCKSLEECYCGKYPKQETIEKVLPKNSNGKYSRNEIEKAFELGAKWQQEQDKNKFS